MPLTEAHAAFTEWMFQSALPFWATSGMDGPGLGFHESLALDGRPFGAPFKRLRVQARQIYVFSHAAMLGWPAGLDAARSGFDFIRRHALHDDGAWAKLLGASGGVLDPSPDLYDIAFVILALSWFARASGDEQALDLASQTVEWTWRYMRAPGQPGFENMLPSDPGPRQQNPHMHLLEALLALQQTSPNPALPEKILELAGLFQRHFFDAVSGTVGEYFDRSLAPVAGAAGTLVEPGHQYEWLWLLHQCEQIIGSSLAGPIDRLYAFANAHGSDPVTGLVRNAVDRGGVLRDAATRIWPQTEALRAHLTQGVRTSVLPVQKIHHCVAALVRHYLNRTPRGTWMDALDGSGAPAITKVPASTFYHLMTAYAALDDFTRHGAV